MRGRKVSVRRVTKCFAMIGCQIRRYGRTAQRRLAEREDALPTLLSKAPRHCMLQLPVLTRNLASRFSAPVPFRVMQAQTKPADRLPWLPVFRQTLPTNRSTATYTTGLAYFPFPTSRTLLPQNTKNSDMKLGNTQAIRGK